jgi:hypothetical protein
MLPKLYRPPRQSTREHLICILVIQLYEKKDIHFFQIIAPLGKEESEELSMFGSEESIT